MVPFAWFTADEIYGQAKWLQAWLEEKDIWYVMAIWCSEECIQQAKGETGLDQYQMRTWRAWHAHTTLSMLALAWLAAARAQAVKKGPMPFTVIYHLSPGQAMTHELPGGAPDFGE
jgi:hypothetical protein